MQLKVDQVGQLKQGQYGPYGSIKSGNDWYTVNGDPAQYAGKIVDGDIETKQGRNGQLFKVLKNVKVVEQQQQKSAAQSNNHIPWTAYEAMAKLAHTLALELEPDGSELGETQTGDEAHTIPLLTVDRSAARIRFVNNVMMAFKDGRVGLPQADEDPFG
jgi:hypothetical protein